MLHAAALLLAVLVPAAAVAAWWPRRGAAWRRRLLPGRRRRAAMEDALKHLFDCEYRGRLATLAGVSGGLGLSAGRAGRVLAQLEQRQLAAAAAGGYRLTPEGRAYALRIVRIHRLWERYLAEATGLDPAAWHLEAERLEHVTSAEEAKALSARLGHPRFDPHGDPIPTADGEIPPPRGRPLTDLPAGRLAEIVHVEDEPQQVYARLLAAGLEPGMRVRVLERRPKRLRIAADGEERTLAASAAANLSVVPLPAGERMEGPFDHLADLELGETARVVGFGAACRGPERRRLLDLGLLPGTEVQAELRSPAGDPTAYRVRGAVIALRSSQARRIRVERPGRGGA